MAYDYDRLYGETRNALGNPTPVFMDFFDRFDRDQASVLDVGCGQGRDALFIARRGYRVVGVDISPHGIRDLTVAAEAEGLEIEGVVADLSEYRPSGAFDVVLADRTLHMLPTTVRLGVLRRLLDHTRDGGWMLIADEPSNIGAFEAVIADHPGGWETEMAKRGYLFVRRR